MTKYGEEFEETHQSMRLRRRERQYSGHKLAVAVGHNKLQRTIDEGSTRRRGKKG